MLVNRRDKEIKIMKIILIIECIYNNHCFLFHEITLQLYKTVYFYFVPVVTDILEADNLLKFLAG